MVETAIGVGTLFATPVVATVLMGVGIVGLVALLMTMPGLARRIRLTWRIWVPRWMGWLRRHPMAVVTTLSAVGVGLGMGLTGPDMVAFFAIRHGEEPSGNRYVEYHLALKAFQSGGEGDLIEFGVNRVAIQGTKVGLAVSDPGLVKDMVFWFGAPGQRLVPDEMFRMSPPLSRECGLVGDWICFETDSPSLSPTVSFYVWIEGKVELRFTDCYLRQASEDSGYTCRSSDVRNTWHMYSGPVVTLKP
jgi:hypothetical protein